MLRAPARDDPRRPRRACRRADRAGPDAAPAAPAAQPPRRQAAPAAAQPPAAPAPAPGPAPSVSLSVSRQPAARARDGALLHDAADRRDLRPGAARSGAEGPLRDRIVRRRRQIAGADTGNLIIQVRENPVINRIVLEGNQADQGRQDHAGDPARAAPDLHPLARPAPTSPGSSSSIAARAASPPASSRKIVQLDQNRVDVVFEINEGPNSQVRQINIIGNAHFGERPPDPGNGDPRARLVQYLQLRRHLRSRPAGLRPAEAAAILPDPGLCRFPRRLRGRRADPGQRDFIITYVRRGGRALQIRRRRRRERDPRLQARTGCARGCRCMQGNGTTPSRSRTRSPA